MPYSAMNAAKRLISIDMEQIRFLCNLVIAVIGTIGLLLFIGYVLLWAYHPIVATIVTLTLVLVIVVMIYHRLKMKELVKSHNELVDYVGIREKDGN